MYNICCLVLDDERKFGYVRIVTGDEMSKRSKFVFITWVGQDVSAMQKAKLSVDKSVVKNIIKVSVKLVVILFLLSDSVINE